MVLIGKGSSCERAARRQGTLFVEGGVDITAAATLKADLWRGVSQTAVAVGPVFGKLPGGGMGCAPMLVNQSINCSSMSKYSFDI